MKHEKTFDNTFVGAYIRHFDNQGNSRYLEFNDAANKILECDSLTSSPHWRQDLEDENDNTALKSNTAYKTDYPLLKPNGDIYKWLAFTKIPVITKNDGCYIITTIVDETLRKQNEELVEEQNSILEAMYRYIPIGVVRLDLQGRVLYANEKIVEILEIKNKEAILGKTVFNDSNFPADIKDKILSFENGVSFQAEYDFGLIAKNKSYVSSFSGIKVLKNKYSVIYNNLHQPIGFMGTTEDVTDTVKNEEILSLTQQNLSLVLKNGSMSTWNYDVDKSCFYVNNGIDIVADRISYDDYFNNLLFPEYIKSSKAAFDDVITGVRESGGNTYKSRDPKTGKAIYRKTSFFAVKNNKGQVTNVLGTSYDVTDIYTQQEELVKSRNELNLALETGDISAWTYDVEKKMFTTLYGHAMAGSGLKLEDAIDLLHPDDKPKMLPFLNAVINGDSTHEIQIFRFKADDILGGYRYYDSRVLGRFENGRIAYLTGTQKDVTEQYLHQIQLEEFTLKTNLINSACNVVQFDYDMKRHAIISYAENALLPGVDIPLEKYLEFVHPDDRDNVAEIFRKGENHEIDKFSVSMRLRLPGSDKFKPVISDGVAIKDKDGTIVKFTGVRRDMSEWEELNKQLKEQNTLNKLIVDNINVGLILFDTKCKVLWTNFEKNSPALNAMGMKPFTVGKKCVCLVEGKCIFESCPAKTSINTQKTSEEEYAYDSGSSMEITANPVFDDENKVMGSIVKVRDITEKKRTDSALNKAKEDALVTNQLLNAIIDRIPGALFIKNVNEDFSYYIANKMFCTLSGKEISEIIGHKDNEVFSTEHSEMFYSYDTSLKEGVYSTVTYETMIPMNNENRYWQICKSVFKADDGRLLILGIATDISDIREANIELKEAKIKAEESDNLKSAFLANMSHEIRTPLNAIVGFSDLLTETDDAKDKAEYCKIISNNSEMLLRLIGDILDLSKIESGITSFNRHDVDLASYFNEIASSLKQRCNDPDVKFIIESPYSSCHAYTDKDRFGQVITNFVTNAIKYTRSGYIKVGYIIENNGIKIYTEDTGIGIPEDKKGRVFNRFDKLDSFAQGTGLGLTIVKAISEEGGGKCGFESTEGKGSYFWAWKPLDDIKYSVIEKDALLPSEKLKKADSVNQFKKILVAEDNESNFILTKSILMDYDVIWARNGEEALQRDRQENFDMILMDIKMPVMDGLEATRKIREFDKEIPIIAVTANAFPSDEAMAIEAGCNSFLAKPIKKADLLKKISEL